jgi:plasmid stabilization system protein ParE
MRNAGDLSQIAAEIYFLSCCAGGLPLRAVAGTKDAVLPGMARGSKTKYSDKQKRQAEHIEKSYEKRGASKKTAEKRAWQTVNKQTGGGEKSGGGRKASSGAKRAARKESGRRSAASRKVGSRKVQKTPTRHKASASRKRS